MHVLQELDPAGVVLRQSHRLTRRVYLSRVCFKNYTSIVSLLAMLSLQGPNFCWHMDGYDKLTPFGIGVHACIDGYVQTILLTQPGILYHTNCAGSHEKSCGSRLHPVITIQK